MSNQEYAKLFRWYAPTSTVYGLKASIKLPTSTSLPAPLGNGFFNFYLAADGKDVDGNTYHYECGLSQDLTNSYTSPYYWHWFWTTPSHGNGGGRWDIFPGSTVPLELSINPTTKQIEYKVNGVIQRTFVGNGRPFNNLQNARLVIATCDQRFLTAPSQTATLPAWSATHNTVTITNLQYRNAPGSWNNFTGTPQGEVHWPVINNTTLPHQGTPLNYTYNVTSPGSLTASLL